MHTLEKISAFFGKYMAIIVLAAALLSLVYPDCALWIQTGWANYLLMLVMFGMGLTLKRTDFKIVFTHPKDILVGTAAQFIIMPLLALLLGKLFRLDAALFAGVILVGTCPGGTSSNVITYLSGGDVPLSVGMTGVNTLLAPVLTPLITYFMLRTTVSVNALSMCVSMLQIVVLPITLGCILNHFFGTVTQRAVRVLPLVSVTAITLLMSSIVSHNAQKILTAGITVLTVVVLHNLLGYVCGYLLAVVLKLPLAKKKAMAIEVGMQNSGLAVSLAASAFPGMAMAAVPGAVFSVVHNLTGAILAGILRRLKET